MAIQHSSTLIPYENRVIGEATIPTVDGRVLYDFLGISRDYSNWMKAQIKRGQFVEGRDYTVERIYETRANSHAQKGEQQKQVLASIEYYFTFDATKHIGMFSGSKKGHEIREYFLDCEKRLHEQPVTRGDLLVQMAEAYRRIEAEQAAQKDALIAAQYQTIEALKTSQRAEHKSDMALDEAHRMTLEEFILKNGLIRQFPYSKHQEYARWLGDFCFQYDLKTPKAPVLGKSWDEEKQYPLQALAAWLRHEQRKPQQIHLVEEA